MAFEQDDLKDVSEPVAPQLANSTEHEDSRVLPPLPRTSEDEESPFLTMAPSVDWLHEDPGALFAAQGLFDQRFVVATVEDDYVRFCFPQLRFYVPAVCLLLSVIGLAAVVVSFDRIGTSTSASAVAGTSITGIGSIITGLATQFVSFKTRDSQLFIARAQEWLAVTTMLLAQYGSAGSYYNSYNCRVSPDYCERLPGGTGAVFIALLTLLGKPRMIFALPVLLLLPLAPVFSVFMYDAEDTAIGVISKVVFVAVLSALSASVGWTLEKRQRRCFVSSVLARAKIAAVHVARQDLDNRLSLLVPPLALEGLLASRRPIDASAEATVAVLDVVNLPHWCSCARPRQAALVLAQFFGVIEECVAAAICVDRLQSLGDRFVAGANLLRPYPDHALVVCDWLLDVSRQLVRYNSKLVGIEALPLRGGVATGAAVGAVFGTALPRYEVFGPAVECAWRVLAFANAGETRIAPSTHARVLGLDAFGFESPMPAGDIVEGSSGTVYLLTPPSAPRIIDDERNPLGGLPMRRRGDQGGRPSNQMNIDRACVGVVSVPGILAGFGTDFEDPPSRNSGNAGAIAPGEVAHSSGPRHRGASVVSVGNAGSPSRREFERSFEGAGSDSSSLHRAENTPESMRLVLDVDRTSGSEALEDLRRALEGSTSEGGWLAPRFASPVLEAAFQTARSARPPPSNVFFWIGVLGFVLGVALSVAQGGRKSGMPDWAHVFFLFGVGVLAFGVLGFMRFRTGAVTEDQDNTAASGAAAAVAATAVPPSPTGRASPGALSIPSQAGQSPPGSVVNSVSTGSHSSRQNTNRHGAASFEITVPDLTTTTRANQNNIVVITGVDAGAGSIPAPPWGPHLITVSAFSVLIILLVVGVAAFRSNPNVLSRDTSFMVVVYSMLGVDVVCHHRMWSPAAAFAFALLSFLTPYYALSIGVAHSATGASSAVLLVFLLLPVRLTHSNVVSRREFRDQLLAAKALPVAEAQANARRSVLKTTFPASIVDMALKLSNPLRASELLCVQYPDVVVLAMRFDVPPTATSAFLRGGIAAAMGGPPSSVVAADGGGAAVLAMPSLLREESFTSSDNGMRAVLAPSFAPGAAPAGLVQELHPGQPMDISTSSRTGGAAAGLAVSPAASLHGVGGSSQSSAGAADMGRLSQTACDVVSAMDSAFSVVDRIVSKHLGADAYLRFVGDTLVVADPLRAGVPEAARLTAARNAMDIVYAARRKGVRFAAAVAVDSCFGIVQVRHGFPMFDLLGVGVSRALTVLSAAPSGAAVFTEQAAVLLIAEVCGRQPLLPPLPSGPASPQDRDAGGLQASPSLSALLGASAVPPVPSSAPPDADVLLPLHTSVPDLMASPRGLVAGMFSPSSSQGGEAAAAAVAADPTAFLGKVEAWRLRGVGYLRVRHLRGMGEHMSRAVSMAGEQLVDMSGSRFSTA